MSQLERRTPWVRSCWRCWCSSPIFGAFLSDPTRLGQAPTLRAPFLPITFLLVTFPVIDDAARTALLSRLQVKRRRRLRCPPPLSLPLREGGVAGRRRPGGCSSTGATTPTKKGRRGRGSTLVPRTRPRTDSLVTGCFGRIRSRHGEHYDAQPPCR